MSKQIQWDFMAQEVESRVNALEMLISDEIKETAIILNLLGLRTVQASWGNLKDEHAYPWISFESRDELEFNKQLDDVCERLADEEESLMINHNISPSTEMLDQPEAAAFNQLFAEYSAMLDKRVKIQYRALLPLQELLKDFYETRPIHYDYVLRITPHSMRLESSGAAWQLIRSDEERAAYLQAYQNEMQDFTAFLKERFFKVFPLPAVDVPSFD